MRQRLSFAAFLSEVNLKWFLLWHLKYWSTASSCPPHSLHNVPDPKSLLQGNLENDPYKVIAQDVKLSIGGIKL
jgi:hypothetical protein